MKDLFKVIADITVIAIIIISIVLCAIGCFRSCISPNNNTTSPVEEVTIDSLNQANSIIIIEVEHLDSIKHVKSIEVKNLDNDSTLKLFYELIGK